MSPEIGLSEVAELLGVSKTTAAQYTNRPDFPPARKLARGRLWDSDAVKAWDAATRPLPAGRPPSAA